MRYILISCVLALALSGCTSSGSGYSVSSGHHTEWRREITNINPQSGNVTYGYRNENVAN